MNVVNQVEHDVHLDYTTKCGFIAIVGKPNAGKSTLLNHLIGKKISGTSNKVQTTRSVIRGIRTINDAQYIFLDTPGFQKKYISEINTSMNHTVIDSIMDADLILFTICPISINEEDKAVLDVLANANCLKKTILVITKNDWIKSVINEKKTLHYNLSQEILQNQKLSTNSQIVKKVKLPEKYRRYNRDLASSIEAILDDLERINIVIREALCSKSLFQQQCLDVVITAAKHNYGLDQLFATLNKHLPIGVFLYPLDQTTDQTISDLINETIREKIFRYLGDELPYQLEVGVDRLIEEDEIYRIYANVYVLRNNHIGMVVGQGGAKLKKISTESRIDLEKLLEKKIYLLIEVKVSNKAR